jgi:hypothetical protein
MGPASGTSFLTQEEIDDYRVMSRNFKNINNLQTNFFSIFKEAYNIFDAVKNRGPFSIDDNKSYFFLKGQ